MRERGFTLIELMIVVAIIAIVASIAIPNLISARLNANENAAIATLRTISGAQAQCRANNGIDVNLNGAGEYGFFSELSGVAPVRITASGTTGTEYIDPSLLPPSLGSLQSMGGVGILLRSGYYFLMLLPSTATAAAVESASGGQLTSTLDPTLAEIHFKCYAWPAAYGSSGRRAFFVDESGDILTCQNAVQRYSGTSKPPTAYAANLAGAAAQWGSTVAANATGQDAQRWLVVN